MQGREDSQHGAELRQAFLRHLPKRLDSVRRRGRRMCQLGWDINALALLFDELQTLAGACGRCGLLGLGEQLFALENQLAPFVENVAIPDAEASTAILSALESLSTPTQQSTGTARDFAAQAADELVTPDGIQLQVVPPADFIARFARAVPDPDAPQPAADTQALDLATPVAANEPAPATAAAGAREADSAPTVAPSALATPMFPAAAKADGRRVYHLSDGNATATELDQRLEAQGFQLEIPDSADELKEVIRALTPSLVIVDAAFLDAIEGIGQAVRSVRVRASQRVALMVLSDNGDVSTRLRAMRAGADSFIPLPAPPADIVARIHELLDVDTSAPFRVMIIEDDRSQALFAESILRKAGMETCAVMDPLSALEALDQFDPELILMDLYMPNCDGMELTTLIREKERFISTPIVFLSGEHDTDKRFDALSAGGDDYLEKPIRPKYLISAVTNRVRRARALNRRVQAQNPRDPLSGLYERAHVLDRISETLAGDEPGTNLGGVLFMIIDGAQAIRERIGLSTFDTLLAQAGTLLTSLISGTELAARYGDTSFLVLCPGRAEAELLLFGEEIRSRFERQLFETGDKSITLAVSVGAATFAQGWPDAATMLNAAERACAQARSSPERKVRLFEIGQSLSADGGPDVAGEIRDALRYDKFQLLFQPIASLRGTVEEQFQVLLRLRAEDGKLHTAAELIPIAEKAGLVATVDRWVLARCMMVLAERARMDKPVRLFVSQSIDSALDEQRLPWLRQQFETRKVPPEQLVLEFRYSDVLARLRQASEFCEAARALGVRIGLTWFEASTASFQLLQHIEVDYLKVSPKYISPAHGPSTKQELRQLIGHAHERKIRVVAPLVETAQTAASLWNTGVDFIQGDFVQQASQDLEFDFRASAM